jgi:hypothetical protein
MGSIAGQEMPVPASLQGELLPKILLLNSDFSSKSNITIGIIYNENIRSSVEVYNDIVLQLRQAQFKVTFIIIPIGVSGTGSIKQLITQQPIDCIYIAPLRGIDFSIISKICKELKILTISATPSLVYTYFSIGFEVQNDKPKIVVNLKSADDEGIILSSRLLKISKLVNKNAR